MEGKHPTAHRAGRRRIARLIRLGHDIRLMPESGRQLPDQQH